MFSFNVNIACIFLIVKLHVYVIKEDHVGLGKNTQYGAGQMTDDLTTGRVI
jgi:hypothetical protein